MVVNVSTVSSSKSKYLSIISQSVAAARAILKGAEFRKHKSGCRLLKDTHQPSVTLRFTVYMLRVENCLS